MAIPPEALLSDFDLPKGNPDYSRFRHRRRAESEPISSRITQQQRSQSESISFRNTQRRRSRSEPLSSQNTQQSDYLLPRTTYQGDRQVHPRQYRHRVQAPYQTQLSYQRRVVCKNRSTIWRAVRRHIQEIRRDLPTIAEEKHPKDCRGFWDTCCGRFPPGEGPEICPVKNAQFPAGVFSYYQQDPVSPEFRAGIEPNYSTEPELPENSDQAPLLISQKFILIVENPLVAEFRRLLLLVFSTLSLRS